MKRLFISLIILIMSIGILTGIKTNAFSAPFDLGMYDVLIENILFYNQNGITNDFRDSTEISVEFGVRNLTESEIGFFALLVYFENDVMVSVVTSGMRELAPEGFAGIGANELKITELHPSENARLVLFVWEHITMRPLSVVIPLPYEYFPENVELTPLDGGAVLILENVPALRADTVRAANFTVVSSKDDILVNVIDVIYLPETNTVKLHIESFDEPIYTVTHRVQTSNLLRSDGGSVTLLYSAWPISTFEPNMYGVSLKWFIILDALDNPLANIAGRNNVSVRANVVNGSNQQENRVLTVSLKRENNVEVLETNNVIIPPRSSLEVDVLITGAQFAVGDEILVEI